MTGYDSKRQMAAGKDALFEKFELAQPAQEPVAWTLLLVGEHHGVIGKAGEQFLGHPKHYERVDVYTAPPKREWVGLTNEEVLETMAESMNSKVLNQKVYEAIEAKLKEKNT